MSDDPPDHFHDINLVLDELVRIGWVEEWGHAGGRLAVIYTPKGAERARWLNIIETETACNEKTMTVLRAIAAMCPPPPDGGDDLRKRV